MAQERFESLIRYDGKRVLVTGAASGMGRCTARYLSELGADVHCLDVKEPEDDLGRFWSTDLRDPHSIDEAVRSIGGPVHSLFNCAGLPMTREPLDIVKVNFLGLRQLTEEVIPLMPPGSTIGSIATIALGWAEALPITELLLATETFEEGVQWCKENPEHVGEGYEFSKNCVIAYSMKESASLIAKGLRINCIGPGATDTPMLPAFVEAVGVEGVGMARSVIGRNSTPEEQAAPLVFLNSDAATYTTGAILYNDGGFSAAAFTGTLSFSQLIADS